MKVKAQNGLIRILKEEGVEWVSTFPQTIFNNACGEEGLPNLMARTERFAVAIADGFSRVSNGKRFGVCSVMGGLNAAGTQMAYGALAQAYLDSTPILCLTDGVSLNKSGVEHYNIEDAFKSVTKWSGYINKAERVTEFMTRAFSYLRSGCLGPILLQIPEDLCEYDYEKYPYTPVKECKFQGNPKDIEVAVRALLSAKKSLIYIGQGIFYADACDELLEFAELVQAPVLTTLKGKSAFPENHPLSIGVRGIPAERFLLGSDLIFMIGRGQVGGEFSNSIPIGKKIIQCTIDPLDINRYFNVDLAILGDAKLVLKQLIDEVKKQGRSNIANKDLLKKIEISKNEHKEKYSPLLTSDEKPINPYRVYWELMCTIDRNNSFVTPDSGNTRDQLSTVYESIIPHGFMGWGNVSTLGFGLGAAIGAKLAFQDRQVVNITGDAGVGYQLGNYETLVRNEIGITTIHINNSGFGGYGSGFWGPGHTPFTADLTPSSKLNMAKALSSMGEYSERVEEPDEIAPAIKRALNQNKSGNPAYIEIICSKYPIFDDWV